MTSEKTFYKYETHLHTREASACGLSSAASMVRAYQLAGYAGIIVTDHFYNGNSAIPRDLPWNEWVNRFCLGYEHALAAAGEEFDVFFGWEYAYHGTEFLTYGLDKAFLLEFPGLLNWKLEHYFDVVHEHGGFIVHAHPFREADYIFKIRLYPEYVDGVEVHNAGNRLPVYDQRALAYAIEHNLCQTSGSDAHWDNPLRGGGMAFDRRLHSIGEFIEAVKDPASYQLLR
jgi:hypothetical protein